MTGRERFISVVRSPRPSLGEASFAIASHLGHPLAIDAGLDLLDGLAAATLGSLEGPPDLDGIARHLFHTVGFRGNHTEYGEVRNSLLPEVLRRRTGIPITLSIVVIEVAERLGVRATGVGMPGHFLVGDGVQPTRWLDSFDGGAWLDGASARNRFHAIHGLNATFDPTFLAPTPAPQIMARVLANLAGAHRVTGDPSALLRVLELRAEIPVVGASPRAQVELAEALAAVGRIDDAVELLDALGQRLDPRRRDALLGRIATLRAGLN